MTFFCADSSAKPNPYFAKEPYSACPSGGENKFWYVANAQGVNCLTFPHNAGCVFTTEKNAKDLALSWNIEKPTQ